MSEEVELSVPEMDCPTCAGKVERALSRVDGVDDIELHPTMGRVTFMAGGDTLENAIAAIERAGYPVEQDADGVERYARPAIWRTRRALLTAVGALLSLFGGAIVLITPAAPLELWSFHWWSVSLPEVAFLVATLVAGVPVLRDGFYSARQRNLDIDLLMSIAIVAAVIASLPFESAMLAVLYSIAELLERHSMDRARSSVRELMDLSPTTARRLRSDGQHETVSVSALSVDDTVAVRPGERIPVDGVVTDGTSAVDQSPITGESVPAEIGTGDEVFAGTINEEGYLEVRVEAAAGETTLDRIIELVEDAETGKTDHEQLIDRFATYYTPTIVVLALLTATGPPLLVDASWGTWFLRGLTLLVIACPCAFVISTPVSVVSGITSAARNGVLIKGGRHLEAMADVDIMAFDKTGTMTTGTLSVTEVTGLTVDDDEVLSRAAALEERSSHPIATAITDHADSVSVSMLTASDVQTHPGRGVSANIENTRYYVGSPGFFRDLGFDLSALRYRPDGGLCEQRGAECSHEGCENLAEEVIADIEADGQTVILTGSEDRIEGVIAVRDTVRDEARNVVETLHEAGVRVVLLTGDNEGAARAVADEVGIDEFHAALLPDEKLDHIEMLEAEQGSVAMIGDGVNDAPALAAATVGVAMGAAGTDTAIEASDIALMGDDLGTVPYLHRLAEMTEGVIQQNILASLAVKAILVLGAPLGIVTVVHAVLIGDMGMSLGVTGNAMRLSRFTPG